MPLNKTPVPNLKQALVDAFNNAERDLSRARANLMSHDELWGVKDAAAALADAGRGITWDANVIERDIRNVEQGYGGDERPGDLRP